MEIDSSTIDELVEILSRFVETERERQSFLIAALGTHAPVLRHINWGDSVATFIPHMLGKLLDHGGIQALCKVLEYARSQMSYHEDVQQRINQLLDKLQIPPLLPPSSAEAEYRKVVERVSSDGKISVTGRHILDQSKQDLGISQEKAEKIEAEVLLPFDKYQKRLDEFIQILVKQIHDELPFSRITRNNLETLYSQLKITDVEALYINLGNELYKQNNLKQSIDVYREVLLINRNNAITHQILATFLLQYGQVDDAIAQYQEAILIQPNNVKLHVDLGNIFYAKAQFSKAIEAYQEAIQLNPKAEKLAEIHYLLGCTFYECEHLEDAIAQYTQAININSQYAKAYAGLGKCQYGKKNFVDAISDLRTAINFQRDNSEYYYYLGMVLSSQGKYKDAIIEFKQAIDFNAISKTPDPMTYTHYAIALLAQNKQKEAETEIQLAIKLFKQQDMGDAAEQMEHLFKQIKDRSGWKNFFKRFP